MEYLDMLVLSVLIMALFKISFMRSDAEHWRDMYDSIDTAWKTYIDKQWERRKLRQKRRFSRGKKL